MTTISASAPGISSTSRAASCATSRARSSTNCAASIPPSIVLAHDLAPSDTAGFDRKIVLGIATEAGSRTSHSAIMARSLNLPAVVGLRDVVGRFEPGVEVLIDGYEGLLIIYPTEQTKFEYGQREKEHHDVDVQLDALRETLPITTDQRRVIVSANVEILDDLPLIREHGAEGIGLLRTEYLFLNQDSSPTEDEQTEMYVQMAQASQPHHLIIRTLDVGGDKKRPHLGIEQEVNPFLGFRGIRYSLGRPEIFRTQLRAICRASAEGNVRVMFPMVCDVAELIAARRLLDEVCEELRTAHIPQADRIEVGVMIEVPSAALTADNPRPPRRLLQHRQQRPHPVHAGHRPRQRKRRRHVPARPPRRAAAHAERGRGGAPQQHLGRRLRRGGRRRRAHPRAHRPRRRRAQRQRRLHPAHQARHPGPQLRRGPPARRALRRQRVRRAQPRGNSSKWPAALSRDPVAAVYDRR
ncbi:MAG: putative PEP-binding protein [Verrucomicrobiota bacterium]